MKTLLTIVFCFIFFSVTAQHKYDWSKYDSLPFKEDSVQSFNNTEVQNHIIYPIKESKADIEIRFYTTDMISTIGAIYTIKYFKDTILLNQYSYRYGNWSPIDMGGFEFVGKFGGVNGSDICRRVTSKSIKKNSLLILDTAIKSKLFTINDCKLFYDSAFVSKKITLKEPEYDCTDCDRFILCEIKSGKRFRNFKLWTRASDYYNTNKNIDLLNYNKELFKFFNSTFR
jgi:hypothetical protein